MGDNRSARVPGRRLSPRLIAGLAAWRGKLAGEFAKACYAMFAVAVSVAVLKLGGALDAGPAPVCGARAGSDQAFAHRDLE